MSALHCFDCGGDCLLWVCDRDRPTVEELVGQPMITGGITSFSRPKDRWLRRLLRGDFR